MSHCHQTPATESNASVPPPSSTLTLGSAARQEGGDRRTWSESLGLLQNKLAESAHILKELKDLRNDERGPEDREGLLEEFCGLRNIEETFESMIIKTKSLLKAGSEKSLGVMPENRLFPVGSLQDGIREDLGAGAGHPKEAGRMGEVPLQDLPTCSEVLNAHTEAASGAFVECFIRRFVHPGSGRV